MSIVLGIITYFCPCYVFGKNAESVGDSCCLCGLVYFIEPVNLYARTHIRGKIREKKGINVSDLFHCYFSTAMGWLRANIFTPTTQAILLC